ncbi:MAG TPA: hypothetical protein VH349_00425 [Ktedonobacterales bacterium]|jgi:hypothetical protein
MIAFLKRILLALLVGYVFVYFSEMLFWARPLESTTFPGILGTILVYAFAAWLFLAVVTAFRVRSLAALFLAGAVFGWLIEGVFVQTLYGELPISVSLTGLSWHALITVLFGWYLLQWSLRFASAWRTLGIAILAGTIAGAWSLTWWAETGERTPIITFATYIGVATLCLILVYWLISLLRVSAFRPTLVETVIVLLLALAYFALVTIPAQPLALFILPPLLLVVLVTLYHNRRVETRANLLVLLAAYPVRIANALALLAFPLAATAVYTLAFETGFSFNTGAIVYVVTIPAGFLLFIWALIAVWRRRRVHPAVIHDQGFEVGAPTI